MLVNSYPSHSGLYSIIISVVGIKSDEAGTRMYVHIPGFACLASASMSAACHGLSRPLHDTHSSCGHSVGEQSPVVPHLEQGPHTPGLYGCLVGGSFSLPDCCAYPWWL